MISLRVDTRAASSDGRARINSDTEDEIPRLRGGCVIGRDNVLAAVEPGVLLDGAFTICPVKD